MNGEEQRCETCGLPVDDGSGTEHDCPPGFAVSGGVVGDGSPTGARTCHCCGLSIAPRDPDPWEGRMDDYCTSCAANRCDCYPDECPVERGVASSSGAGHDACPDCGTPGGAYVTHTCMPDRDVPEPDLPVAAPDHADEIRAALKALRGWLPEPQNKAASGGYDAEIVKVRRAHKAGLAALDALLAERQQDKERIEELRDALGEAERVIRVTSGWNPDRVTVLQAIEPAAEYLRRAALAVEEDARG